MHLLVLAHNVIVISGLVAQTAAHTVGHAARVVGHGVVKWATWKCPYAARQNNIFTPGN